MLVVLTLVECDMEENISRDEPGSDILMTLGNRSAILQYNDKLAFTIVLLSTIGGSSLNEPRS